MQGLKAFQRAVKTGMIKLPVAINRVMPPRWLSFRKAALRRSIMC